MKYCFLVNTAPFLMEFFGKMADEVVKRGDECLVLFSGKFAEYEKKQYFPEQATFISKVDWSLAHYNPHKKDFGDLSWAEFYPSFDRIKHLSFGFEETHDWISQEYQFFEYICQQEKPDVMLFEPPSGLFSGMAYYCSQRQGIPYLGITNSRIDDNKLDVDDLKWTSSTLKTIFHRLQDADISSKEREFVKVFIKDYIKHTYVPFYVTLSKISFSPFGLFAHYVKRVRQRIKILFSYLIGRHRFGRYDFEGEIIFKCMLQAPWKMQERQIRIYLQKHLYHMLNTQDAFFLYPLHLQPESSTSMFASYYSDQLYTIKHIAFSLPFPFKLYVKEHPQAIGTKSMNFYWELKRIPNVVLISPYEDVSRLIKQSSGVITLTGTIGMEAAFAGKPAYVFGDVSYVYHPMCRKVHDFTDLQKHIQADVELGYEISESELERINIHFIISCTRSSISGNLFSASMGNDLNDYKEICEKIKTFAETKKKI